MELPRDEWTQVISFLDYRDLGRLAQCSRGFYELTQDYIDPTMDNDTPIIVSCSRGYYLAAKKLLADPRVDPHAESDLALKGAVMNGKLSCLDLLLQLDFPLDSLNIALVEASKRGSIDIVRRLLRDGRCDPSYRNYKSLYYASTGSDELFSLLVPYGYDEDSLPCDLSASKAKMLPEPPISLLADAVEYNNLDLISYLAPLALPERVSIALRRACRYGYYQAAKLLIPYIEDWHNDICLYLASINGSVELVKLLLERGITPCLLSLRGAVDRGNLDVIGLLLPLVDPRDLILRACKSGNNDVVNLLIPRTDMARYGHEALVKACSSGCLKIVDRLLGLCSPTIDCLNRAANGGYSKVVKRLLPKLRGDYSQALELAASRGRTKIVKLLLKVATTVTDRALELSYRYPKIVRLLLPYACPSQDMLLACCAGYPKSLLLLLRDGRVDLTDNRIIPTARDCSECIEILLADGRADPTAQDNTALMEAMNPRTIQLLLADPRIDPAIDDNRAIRNFRNQWVTEKLLEDPRVDPSANGSEALTNASSRCVSSVRRLLEDSRVDPTANNYRAIRTSVEWERVDIFTELVNKIAQGAPISSRGPISPTTLLDIAGYRFCLEYGIRTGDLPFIEWLVGKGASIDSDILDHACRKGDYRIVEYLLASTQPGPETLYYCLDNHQLIRLLYSEERSRGYVSEIIESCIYSEDIDLLKRILSSPSPREVYREDLRYCILSQAMVRRDKELLRLALSRIDPAEYGESLLSLGDEEMNRILLRYPTMEPLRLKLLGAL
jgi:ankyrin repeat protein